ncbi:MAG TPA: VCBS repeat-containing protein [Pirellulaceae bacterium]|nr:VCBS repeat-containing protein [Pirellulaceae bacterium]
MLTRQIAPILFLSLSLLLPAAAFAQATPGKNITFKKTVIDAVFRSEGIAVGDFNKDGKLDIAAGSVWYAAPEWKLQITEEKAPEFDPLAYSRSFQTFADDLNGDGWTDIIVVEFPGDVTSWLENPKKEGMLWPKHMLTRVTNNESPQYLDVDGDGKRDLLAAFSPDPANVDGPQKRMVFMSRKQDPFEPWTILSVSAAGAPGTNRFSHGLGLGDINRDGRDDVLVPQGWWEAPQDRRSGDWKFHPAKLGENCAQMYAFDFDGDGDNDVLSSAAHAVGMWWHEQLEGGEWKTHLIDDSFTQTHALCLADINGDGLPDFVTGKRWWAHGPKGDINPDHPAVMCWFELSREEGKPVWTKHQFDHDSGVGTQFEVADVNGDGLLDVVTSNKKGTFYFEQVRE